MEPYLGIALQIFGVLSGLGVTVAGFGFAFTQFRAGGNKAKDDVIATLKENVAAEKQRSERLSAEKAMLMNSHQEQINLLNEKVGKLQGLYESAETQKKEYLSIIQGMSPEEKQYRQDMREFTIGVAKYMASSAEILEKINTRLDRVSPQT